MGDKKNSRNSSHTNRLNVRLSDEYWGKMDYVCDKNSVNKSDLIRMMLDTYYKIALHKE